ncbi:ABC transporter ATP-binding protein [Gluconobacter albidus]|uniref:ABC transporter ATP-binding protein/permease n=1 Tax=Gluconobacter albidus TaxID=318683 RepID=UPI00098A2A6D|nr:ABC transporter ATP-binding protein/permease [Gluconobacter albidus]AQS89754.1 ABC transporter ATP-binding protein [Gluconobacter albidus]
MQTTDDATPPHSLADWKVLFPYWKSEEKWWAWSLLGGTIGLSVLYVQSAVWFGAWYHRFFDAFFAGEVGRCLGMLPFYLLVTLGSVGVHATQTYLTQVLSMRWRLWNTKVYLRQYLSEEAYYRLEHGPNRADNPDQRIADDLSQMTVQTLKLGLDAIDAVTTLLSFAVVLWNIGGVLSFDWHAHHFHIPGYLFLGAVLTSLVASGILERFGAPLIGANYRQQHFDADLRAGLMDVRRNSEQIAFYGGENAEQLRLSGYLTHIATNWRTVVRYTWRVNFISEFYTGVATIPLWLMLAPKAMAHALSFGLYSQINSAYTQVRISLEWFIFNYADLATLRSVLQRLGEFERVVSQSSRSGIVRFASETPVVQIRDLTLDRPDGAPIARIGDLTIQAGERWLVRGPSGSGKSTFLRALAGLWRHGRGEVSFNMRQAMFLPQRSYVPSGTLRQALSYPATPDHYDTAFCQQALEAVNLAGYGHRLDEAADWGAVLSPGEQQRLAVARALLFRPAILFLDEATSALDDVNERRLYEALLFFLPHTTCVSVAHHDALRVFHDREIVLGSGKAAFSALEK